MLKGSVKCWIEDFRNYVQFTKNPKTGQYYDLPLNYLDFNDLFESWLTTDPKGLEAKHSNRVNTVGKNLKMFSIEAKSEQADAKSLY